MISNSNPSLQADIPMLNLLVTVVILKSSKFGKIIPGNLDNVLSETNDSPFLLICQRIFSNPLYMKHPCEGINFRSNLPKIS